MRFPPYRHTVVIVVAVVAAVVAPPVEWSNGMSVKVLETLVMSTVIVTVRVWEILVVSTEIVMGIRIMVVRHNYSYRLPQRGKEIPCGSERKIKLLTVRIILP